MLCANTFSQTHAEEADMTNSLCLLQMWQMLHHVWQHQSPPYGTQIFLSSRHEPDPYVWTTAKNGDHDATSETPTAATTATGADGKDYDPDDEH